jgi:hypothetical protein
MSKVCTGRSVGASQYLQHQLLSHLLVANGVTIALDVRLRLAEGLTDLELRSLLLLFAQSQHERYFSVRQALHLIIVWAKQQLASILCLTWVCLHHAAAPMLALGIFSFDCPNELRMCRAACLEQ